MVSPAQGEQDRPLGVVGIEPASTVWTVIVNKPRRRHNDSATTLLDPLYMPHMSPRYPAPQAPNVIGFRRQWLSTRSQNR